MRRRQCFQRLSELAAVPSAAGSGQPAGCDRPPAVSREFEAATAMIWEGPQDLPPPALRVDPEQIDALQSVATSTQPVCDVMAPRKRGRPKGSKNRRKH